MSTIAPPRATTRGTPCALSWDDAWVAQIEAREQAADRRICGARSIGGRPCPLPSDHPSGRCRHHGGFPLTGAPADNRNAVIHGLYSRRLLICGTHCPAWQSCPMGGGSTFTLEEEKGSPGSIGLRPMENEPESAIYDAGSPSTHHRPEADATRTARPTSYGQQLLKLPLSERPLCPFEQAEYNAVVTDLMHRTMARPENSYGLHLAHQIALITVMVSRAARALALKPFTEKMERTAEDYYMSVEKPSAGLIAFEKLSRELRRWIAMLDQHYGPYNISAQTEREHALRQQCDTNPDPDEQAALDLTGLLAQKEATRATAERMAALHRMDKEIVESIFARAGLKPKGQTDSTAEAARKPAENAAESGGRVSSRAEDG